MIRKPTLSVIVVVYNMAREAPKTLRSLARSYQRDIESADYEIIVVDNGSDVPFSESSVREFGENFSLIRVDDASPSPARAINIGIEAARGDVIGVMIDGARIATPGLLHFARRAATLYAKNIVATLGFYLGYGFQGWAVAHGYDRAREDALLESIAWPSDGYRLFEIATMDESSIDGWFAPIAESNAVFARREFWDAIGGVDERFDAPGGGLLNLDTFARLLKATDSNLVMLLGEGTFHQVHGGVSTNAPHERKLEKLAIWNAQYLALRGEAWTVPEQSRAYLGTFSPAALARFVRAATHPGAMSREHPPLGADFDPSTWSRTRRDPAADEHTTELTDLGLRYFCDGKLEACFTIARFMRERGMDARGLDEILALASGTLPADTHAPARVRERHLVLGEAHEIVGDARAAERCYRDALRDGDDVARAHVGLARLRMPGPHYFLWLRRLYAELQPESVLEIGVFHGDSLALPKPPTIVIGVDPAPRVLEQLSSQTHIFAETSDDFFANDRIRSVLGDRPVAIGFIDGLHTFEQALRDFIGMEACCGPQSHIILHDTVPLDRATQAREQRTTFYTGDVWKLVLCLKYYRPDLDVFTIATFPTGLTIVRDLDPTSRVLANAYDDALARFADLSYATIENDSYTALGVVPNDWDLVLQRLKTTASPSVGAAPIEPWQPYIVDRDQPPLSPEDIGIVIRFQDLYYRRWRRGADTINLSWHGYLTLKCPLDLWMYQELIARTRPDFVIETGTWCGGSALYLANIFDRLGHGHVISIDLEPKDTVPKHPRITYLAGSSTDAAIVSRVRAIVGGKRAMVMLDSNHTQAHVYAEIEAYRAFVQPGDYLIVEDTNINGHPTQPDFGPGPMEAVREFLATTNDFEIDRRCERFLMTLNPGGYLKRR